MTSTKFVVSDGEIRYIFNNKLHRDDGPAIIMANGTMAWYRHGLPHRDDGPALEHPDGTRKYFRYGIQHRIDGPAVIYGNSNTEWWIDGRRRKDMEPDRLTRFRNWMRTLRFH